MGSLSRTQHSHIPSPSALGSQLPTLRYFLPLQSFICVISQFSYHAKHGKNLEYIHTWFWLPSSITCVQWNNRPKTTGQVHRVGDDRIETRQKTQMCRFHQKPSTHLSSLEQKEATCYSSDPSTIILIPGPPEQEPVLLLLNPGS